MQSFVQPDDREHRDGGAFCARTQNLSTSSKLQPSNMHSTAFPSALLFLSPNQVLRVQIVDNGRRALQSRPRAVINWSIDAEKKFYRFWYVRCVIHEVCWSGETILGLPSDVDVQPGRRFHIWRVWTKARCPTRRVNYGTRWYIDVFAPTSSFVGRMRACEGRRSGRGQFIQDKQIGSSMGESS